MPTIRKKGFKITKELKVIETSNQNIPIVKSNVSTSLPDAAKQCNLVDLSKFGDPTYTFAFIESGFSIGFRVEVEIDGQWNLYYGKTLIEKNHDILKSLPDIIPAGLKKTQH